MRCLSGEQLLGMGEVVSSSMVTASSWHSGGANMLFLDGSVKFIKNSISYATWTGIGTRNGQEVVDASSY